MKLSIRISSLFALALFISTVSVKAQTTSSIDANVPFNFNVWHETYSAGTYKMQVLSDPAGGSVIRISDRHGNPLQTVVAANGLAFTGRTELMFQRRGRDRYLTGLTLPDRALMIGRGNPGKNNFNESQESRSGKVRDK